ncbi:MAG TPA: group I intron-associated PD-(D/E)XK endonuclease [Candidatus Rubrimentiphilum sp.]|nr:group I intron-associated PD-(D/E)XK endonuclease [Candidatus Rubrimentiphilum sp.]
METHVKRNTKRIGDLSEIMVLAALIRAGYYVSIPFGEDHRYDLIAEKDNAVYKVQVKSGRLRKGAILFACYSSHAHRGGGMRRYTGEIDLFGVYCADVDGVYLIPAGDVSAWRRIRLELVSKGSVAEKRPVEESRLGLTLPSRSR